MKISVKYKKSLWILISRVIFLEVWKMAVWKKEIFKFEFHASEAKTIQFSNNKCIMKISPILSEKGRQPQKGPVFTAIDLPHCDIKDQSGGFGSYARGTNKGLRNYF